MGLCSGFASHVAFVQVAGALDAVPRSYVYLLPLSLVIAVYLTFVIYLILGPLRCVAVLHSPPSSM